MILQIAHRSAKAICALGKVSDRGIAASAQQAADTTGGVAMINGQALSGRRASLADGARVVLRCEESSVVRRRYATLRALPDRGTSLASKVSQRGADRAEFFIEEPDPDVAPGAEQRTDASSRVAMIDREVAGLAAKGKSLRLLADCARTFLLGEEPIVLSQRNTALAAFYAQAKPIKPKATALRPCIFSNLPLGVLKFLSLTPRSAVFSNALPVFWAAVEPAPGLSLASATSFGVLVRHRSAAYAHCAPAVTRLRDDKRLDECLLSQRPEADE